MELFSKFISPFKFTKPNQSDIKLDTKQEVIIEPKQFRYLQDVHLKINNLLNTYVSKTSTLFEINPHFIQKMKDYLKNKIFVDKKQIIHICNSSGDNLMLLMKQNLYNKLLEILTSLDEIIIQFYDNYQDLYIESSINTILGPIKSDIELIFKNHFGFFKNLIDNYILICNKVRKKPKKIYEQLQQVELKINESSINIISIIEKFKLNIIIIIEQSINKIIIEKEIGQLQLEINLNDTRIKELTENSKKLEEMNSSLNQFNSSKTENITELNENIRSISKILETNILETNKTISELESSNLELTNNLEQKSSKITEIELLNSELVKQKEELTIVITEYIKDITKFTSDISKLNETKAQNLNTISDLNEQHMLDTEEIKNLTNQNDLSRITITTLKDTIETNTTSINELESINTFNKIIIDKASNSILELEAINLEYSTQIYTHEQTIKQNQETIDTKNTELIRIEEIIIQNIETIRQNHEIIIQNEEQIKQHEETIRHNEEIIIQNIETIRQNEETIRQNEEQIKSMEQTIKSNTEILKKERVDKFKLEMDSQATNQKIIDLNQKISDKKKIIRNNYSLIEKMRISKSKDNEIIDIKTREIKVCEDQNRMHSAQINKFRQSIEEYNSNISIQQQNINKLVNQNLEYSKNITEYKQINEDINKTINIQSKELSRMNQTIDTDKKTITQYEDTIRQNKITIRQYEGKSETNKIQIDTMSKTIAKDKETINIDKLIIEQNREKIIKNERTIKDNEDEIKTNRNTIIQHDATIKDFRKTEEENKKVIKQHTDKISKSTQEIQELKSKTFDLERTLKEFELTNNLISTELEKITKENKNINDKFKESQDKLTELDIKNREYMANIEQLKSEIDLSNQKNDVNTSEIGKLKQDIISKEEIFKNLESSSIKSTAELNIKLTSMTDKFAEYKTENTEIIKELQDDIIKKNTKLEEHKENIRQIETTNYRIRTDNESITLDFRLKLELKDDYKNVDYFEDKEDDPIVLEYKSEETEKIKESEDDKPSKTKIKELEDELRMLQQKIREYNIEKETASGKGGPVAKTDPESAAFPSAASGSADGKAAGKGKGKPVANADPEAAAEKADPEAHAAPGKAKGKGPPAGKAAPKPKPKAKPKVNKCVEPLINYFKILLNNNRLNLLDFKKEYANLIDELNTMYPENPDHNLLVIDCILNNANILDTEFNKKLLYILLKYIELLPIYIKIFNKYKINDMKYIINIMRLIQQTELSNIIELLIEENEFHIKYEIQFGILINKLYTSLNNIQTTPEICLITTSTSRNDSLLNLFQKIKLYLNIKNETEPDTVPNDVISMYFADVIPEFYDTQEKKKDFIQRIFNINPLLPELTIDNFIISINSLLNCKLGKDEERAFGIIIIDKEIKLARTTAHALEIRLLEQYINNYNKDEDYFSCEKAYMLLNSQYLKSLDSDKLSLIQLILEPSDKKEIHHNMFSNIKLIRKNLFYTICKEIKEMYNNRLDILKKLYYYSTSNTDVGDAILKYENTELTFEQFNGLIEYHKNLKRQDLLLASESPPESPPELQGRGDGDTESVSDSDTESDTDSDTESDTDSDITNTDAESDTDDKKPIPNPKSIEYSKLIEEIKQIDLDLGTMNDQSMTIEQSRKIRELRNKRLELVNEIKKVQEPNQERPPYLRSMSLPVDKGLSSELAISSQESEKPKFKPRPRDIDNIDITFVDIDIQTICIKVVTNAIQIFSKYSNLFEQNFPHYPKRFNIILDINIKHILYLNEYNVFDYVFKLLTSPGNLNIVKDQNKHKLYMFLNYFKQLLVYILNLIDFFNILKLKYYIPTTTITKIKCSDNHTIHIKSFLNITKDLFKDDAEFKDIIKSNDLYLTIINLKPPKCTFKDLTCIISIKHFLYIICTNSFVINFDNKSNKDTVNNLNTLLKRFLYKYTGYVNPTTIMKLKRTDEDDNFEIKQDKADLGFFNKINLDLNRTVKNLIEDNANIIISPRRRKFMISRIPPINTDSSTDEDKYKDEYLYIVEPFGKLMKEVNDTINECEKFDIPTLKIILDMDQPILDNSWFKKTVVSISGGYSNKFIKYKYKYLFKKGIINSTNFKEIINKEYYKIKNDNDIKYKNKYLKYKNKYLKLYEN